MTPMKSTKLLILAASIALTATASLAATAAPPTEAEHGFQVFMRVGCYECHGTVGQGGGLAGPHIAPDPPTADRLLTIVRRPLKEMPAYNRRVLSDADVSAIHAYLATIKPPPALSSLQQLQPGSK